MDINRTDNFRNWIIARKVYPGVEKRLEKIIKKATQKKKKDSKKQSEINVSIIDPSPLKPVFGRATLFLQFKTKVITEIKRAFRDSYFLGIIGTAIGFLILKRKVLNSIQAMKTTNF